ncbi:MAG: hypothetical protein IKM13_06930 [Clostridia bacterium]|nr:hypothetical protein [Clostridia bacterium]
MKNKLILSVILNVILAIVLLFTIKMNETKVYSFSGENEYFVIEQGEILKNKKFEQVSYSKFQFKDDIPSKSYAFSMELYFVTKDEKTVIAKQGLKYNPNSGISLSKDDLLPQLEKLERHALGNVYRQLQDVSHKNILNNFYFELTFFTYDGQEITQTLKLDVAETK